MIGPRPKKPPGGVPPPLGHSPPGPTGAPALGQGPPDGPLAAAGGAWLSNSPGRSWLRLGDDGHGHSGRTQESVHGWAKLWPAGRFDSLGAGCFALDDCPKPAIIGHRTLARATAAPRPSAAMRVRNACIQRTSRRCLPRFIRRRWEGGKKLRPDRISGGPPMCRRGSVVSARPLRAGRDCGRSLGGRKCAEGPDYVAIRLPCQCRLAHGPSFGASLLAAPHFFPRFSQFPKRSKRLTGMGGTASLDYVAEFARR